MRLFTAEEREAVTRRLLELLRADDRILDVRLLGSLATGTADAYSDIDLAVRTRPDVELDSIADHWVDLLYDELPVVHHFAVTFDGPVRGFLLEGFLEIDLGFTHRPLGEENDDGAVGDLPARQAGFAWHDVLHAVFALRRRRPWRALYYIGMLRTRTIILASERLELRSDEYTSVDDLSPELLQSLEDSLVGSLEAEALWHATRAATVTFLAELRRFDPGLADRLGALVQFIDLCHAEPG